MRLREDALWAAEQALKSGACGAVMLWLEEGASRRHDEYAWLRRLQMSAESGRAMAVLYRSMAAERLSTPAHLRVMLSREEGVLKVRIPKRRGPSLMRPIAIGARLQRRKVVAAREKLQALRPVPGVSAPAFHLISR